MTSYGARLRVDRINGGEKKKKLSNLFGLVLKKEKKGALKCGGLS